MFVTVGSGGVIITSPGVVLDSISITVDPLHSTAPIVYTASASATGATQDSEFKAALDAAVTAGTLTGVTISAITNVTKVLSNTTGTRVNLDVMITGGSGSTAIPTETVIREGADGTVGMATTYTATAGSPHSPRSIASSFANDLPKADCITQIRNHFVNNDIGGYSEGAIIEQPIRRYK